MMPAGPPYHTMVGNTLTIYLNIISDTDYTASVIDTILSQLSEEWGQIATANNLTVVFAFGTATPPPVTDNLGVTPDGIRNVAAGPPNLPGLYFSTGSTPPAGVNFFNFTVGKGAAAPRATQSARISFVTYPASTGYIYIIPLAVPTVVPHVSHELGHVLGLSDRYYDAVYWLKDWAIERNCRDVRRRTYVVGAADYRDGIADDDPSLHGLPRFAVRVSLPMSTVMVPNDSSYDPWDNLMSNGTAVLTTNQLDVIRSQSPEQTYRGPIKWVAILADWERNGPTLSKDLLQDITDLGGRSNGLDDPTPANRSNNLSAWLFPVWEARPQDGGRGLLFLPKGHNVPHRYGCMSRRGRAQTQDGDTVFATPISVALGRTRVFAFAGQTYNVNGINVNHPGRMCYTRQLINDLIVL